MITARCSTKMAKQASYVMRKKLVGTWKSAMQLRLARSPLLSSLRGIAAMRWTMTSYAVASWNFTIMKPSNQTGITSVRFAAGLKNSLASKRYQFYTRLTCLGMLKCLPQSTSFFYALSRARSEHSASRVALKWPWPSALASVSQRGVKCTRPPSP